MMKKVLAALLAVCMLASLMFIPASAAGFDDVADDHWAKEAIDRWADFGVLNGVGEGSFSPDRGMKRSEFAKFIVELMGLSIDDSEVPFDDVMGTNDEWAAPYITAANKAGIINGVGGNRFSPSRDVKFNEGAAMMARAVGLVESSAFGDTVTDKLTELGMLDDNVKADMTFDRAGVAGLANNMIEVYANDAEADAKTVTGEVSRVILAVNGGKINVENATVKAPIVVTSEASVEVKSSTVEAPIVVDSASVALTETKAADVAVSGEKASVTADKDSTVAEVAVSGTAPSVELNGTVEKVTVAEGTTEVEVKGEGVSKENVKNETGESIKVNGEDVAPTPAEPENPDDNQGGSTGFVPDPVVPPEEVTSGTTGDPAVEDERDSDVVPSAPTDNTGLVAATGKTLCEANAHTWENTKVDPTCTVAGSITYTCSTCGATKTETIAARDHDFTATGRVSFDATKHYAVCKYCDAKDTAHGEEHDFTGVGTPNNVGHTVTCSAAGCNATKNMPHAQVTGEDIAAKWDSTSTPGFHYKKCACGAKFDMAPHSYGAWGPGVQGDLPAGADFDAETQAVEKRTCVCGAKETRVVAKPANPDEGETHTCTQFNWSFNNSTGVCTGTCKTTAAGTVHTVGSGDPKDGTKTHTHTSGVQGECGKTYYNTEGAWYETNPATCTHSGVNKETGGKCSVCGTTVAPCTHANKIYAAVTGDGENKGHPTTCADCQKDLGITQCEGGNGCGHTVTP